MDDALPPEHPDADASAAVGPGWTTPPGWTPPPAGWAPPPGAPPPPSWGPAPAWQPPYVAATAPKPGIVPLRPLSVGEILDGAFTLVRRYPGPTIGFAAAVLLVVDVIQFLLTDLLLAGVQPPVVGPDGLEPAGFGDYVARVSTSAGVGAVITLIGTLTLSGMLTAVAGRAVLGQPMTVRDAWERVRPLLGRVALTSLLLLLLPVVAIAVTVVAIALTALVSTGLAVLVGLVLGAAVLVGGIYLLISWSLVLPALVLERQRIRPALGRSRLLVRGSWWRVLGIILLAGLVASIIRAIVQVPFAVAAGGGLSLFSRTDALTVSSIALSTLGTFIAGTLVQPFQAGIVALLYVDRRMRAEGLDMVLRRASGSQP